jgi:hypothetical protein
MSTDLRLQRPEAAEAIRCLKAHYCDLCDEGYDADKLSELFISDATWDGGDLGIFIGRDKIHRFFSNMPRVMSFAIHHITNSAIHVSEDASSAQGRWYLLQTARMQKDGQAVWLAARYNDDLVFVDDAWKFEKVKIETRFVTPYEDGWGKTPFADLSA